jgi:hypothetical protein
LTLHRGAVVDMPLSPQNPLLNLEVRSVHHIDTENTLNLHGLWSSMYSPPASLLTVLGVLPSLALTRTSGPHTQSHHDSNRSLVCSSSSRD